LREIHDLATLQIVSATTIAASEAAAELSKTETERYKALTAKANLGIALLPKCAGGADALKAWEEALALAS
jgi:hypothetical protein